MINNNRKVSFDRQFQHDVHKWKNQVEDLQGELRGINKRRVFRFIRLGSHYELFH